MFLKTGILLGILAAKTMAPEKLDKYIAELEADLRKLGVKRPEPEGGA